MPLMPGCPQDQSADHGPLDVVLAVVLHRTYGAWAGDYSVIKSEGLAHFLIGKEDGQWVQFSDTTRVQWHANGANFKAVGIELTGTNEDPLTDWQEARLGDVLQFLHAAHGIPLDYTDPDSVPPASIWVNGGGFQGVLSHDSVRTDDGSSQHTDLVTVSDFTKAVSPPPPPPPPIVLPKRKAHKMFLARIVNPNNDSTVELWTEDGIRLGYWSEVKDGPLTTQYKSQGIPVLDYPSSEAFGPVRDALVALKHAGATV